MTSLCRFIWRFVRSIGDYSTYNYRARGGAPSRRNGKLGRSFAYRFVTPNSGRKFERIRYRTESWKLRSGRRFRVDRRGGGAPRNNKVNWKQAADAIGSELNCCVCVVESGARCRRACPACKKRRPFADVADLPRRIMYYIYIYIYIGACGRVIPVVVAVLPFRMVLSRSPASVRVHRLFW